MEASFSMKSPSAVYTIIIITIPILSPPDFDDTKQKRAAGGSVGLFPFPRVGRSDPDMISEYELQLPLSYSSFENYDGNYNFSLNRFVQF